MTRPRLISSLALALAFASGAACKQEKSKLDSVVANAKMPHGTGAGTTSVGPNAEPAGPVEDLDSKDILGRKDTSPEVQVKHVLIGWKDLSAAYRGHMDPRAEARTNADAAKLAREIYERAQKEDFNKLVAEYSEDPGSKSPDAEPYKVATDTQFVPEFKQLALRLMLNEVGIVKTNYGYHIIKRVPPPPPDPLESADILARPPEPGPVSVQHVLIGWKGAPAARTATRTKEEADKLATEILNKVKAGEDMTALMKQYSEDPGSKDTGKPYEVATDTQFVEPFKNLALRLKVGEAGLVKTPFGWHIIKRSPPPPPDALESADILAREPVTQTAKVKHILLSYADTKGEDPRGQKRTRAELEKLVADTVAKLKGGAKIEPLMAELSEDPGSAKSGNSYDATPDAGLVEPFKKLSLRLKPGEVGVVKTEFGYHIIQRVDGTPGDKAPAGAGSAAAPKPAEKATQAPAAGSAAPTK